MPKKALFLVNPAAGKRQSRGPLFDAAATLCQAGYLVNIHQTTGQGDATETARKEGPDYDLVLCSGGDGTLNETISGLMDLPSPPPLGYLPRGSTNDFAASLGISTQPAEAAQAIVRSPGRALDIGRWNDRCFAYVACFGAFTRSSYSAPQEVKNILGHFAYILEGVKDLNSLRPYRVRLTADGEVLDGDYLFGAVCNSTSLGGLMKLGKEAVVLDDGKFEMLLVRSPRTLLEIQGILTALLNQDYRQESLVFRHISALTAEPAGELPWSLDGEYAPSAGRVEIRNCPRALTFRL